MSRADDAGSRAPTPPRAPRSTEWCLPPCDRWPRRTISSARRLRRRPGLPRTRAGGRPAGRNGHRGNHARGGRHGQGTEAQRPGSEEAEAVQDEAPRRRRLALRDGAAAARIAAREEGLAGRRRTAEGPPRGGGRACKCRQLTGRHDGGRRPGLVSAYFPCRSAGGPIQGRGRPAGTPPPCPPPASPAPASSPAAFLRPTPPPSNPGPP